MISMRTLGHGLQYYSTYHRSLARGHQSECALDSPGTMQKLEGADSSCETSNRSGVVALQPIPPQCTMGKRWCICLIDK